MPKTKLGRHKVSGSLLLGLYDDEGLLHHVGFTSAFKADEKVALTERLRPLIASASFTGNTPGGPSRWSTRRSAEWVPLKPKKVVEISYDHFTGGRFRHGTSILRWRPDKSPRQCTFEQLPQKEMNPFRLLDRQQARRVHPARLRNGRNVLVRESVGFSQEKSHG